MGGPLKFEEELVFFLFSSSFLKDFFSDFFSEKALLFQTGLRPSYLEIEKTDSKWTIRYSNNNNNNNNNNKLFKHGYYKIYFVVVFAI